MISQKLRSLGAQLLLRPALAVSVATRLQELAECLEQHEQAAIPPHLHAAGALPVGGNVVRFPGREVRS